MKKMCDFKYTKIPFSCSYSTKIMQKSVSPSQTWKDFTIGLLTTFILPIWIATNLLDLENSPLSPCS